MAQLKKSITTFLKEWSEALAVWTFQKIIPFLPLRLSYALARGIAAIALHLLPKQRKTILGNMGAAFGDQVSSEEKTEAAREMAIHFFKSFFECFYLSSACRNKVRGIASIEGRHHLDQALARGKGVITLSAHFGNFIILGSIMAEEGYPFHMVLKDPPSKPLSRLFQKFRRASGQRWISTTPWREAQKRLLRCLRKNEIICLIADEFKRHGGVAVDFFGHKTPTAVGPAVLSLRTGAALVPLFMVRQSDDTHKIIIEPALEFTPSGNQSEDIYEITSAFTRRIEWYIREHPTQWLWLNSRWKKRSRGDTHHQG